MDHKEYSAIIVELMLLRMYLINPACVLGHLQEYYALLVVGLAACIRFVLTPAKIQRIGAQIAKEF
jgi:hypothetical protein